MGLGGSWCSKKGPSRALAGEGDLLPGIGSNAVPLTRGDDCRTVSRICWLTPEVSQESKDSSWEIRCLFALSSEHALDSRVYDCWRPSSRLDEPGRLDDAGRIASEIEDLKELKGSETTADDASIETRPPRNGFDLAESEVFGRLESNRRDACAGSNVFGGLVSVISAVGSGLYSTDTKISSRDWLWKRAALMMKAICADTERAQTATVTWRNVGDSTPAT